MDPLDRVCHEVAFFNFSRHFFFSYHNVIFHFDLVRETSFFFFSTTFFPDRFLTVKEGR